MTTEPKQTSQSLDEALALFQSKIPTIRKGNTATVQKKAGGSYSYAYADLTDISEVAMPLLGPLGLSFTAQPTHVEGAGFFLLYSLRHVSGESIDGMYPLPDPMRSTPQEVGSAITYARRYALCAVTGIAPGGDDDDAQSAQQAAAARQERKQPAKPAEIEYLPEGLYDLSAIGSADQALTMFRQAQGAGHLHLRLSDGNGSQTVPLGEWLVATGKRLRTMEDALAQDANPADDKPDPDSMSDEAFAAIAAPKDER